MTFLTYNNINNLKMFDDIIDWDKLKEKGIEHSQLLRDLCQFGIK